MTIEATTVKATEPRPDLTAPPPRPTTASARARTVVISHAPDPPASCGDRFTVAAMKGWAGSVSIHVALLAALAFWYFTPPRRFPVIFDTRLAGSPRGSPEGQTLLGGMNAPLEIPDVLLEPTPELPLKFEKSPIEPRLSLRRVLKVPAMGGRPNENPGAGDGDGFGLARFGEGGESIRGVDVKVGDPQFTLIWDTDADLDLHVIEPGGKEIYWEVPRGQQGGELDVDNTRGFGPENIYWLVDAEGPGRGKVKGPGPAGTYRWFVVYWGGFGGIAKPTHWKVRVKHAGKVDIFDGKFRALNERSRIYTLRVDHGTGDSDASPVLPPEKLP